MNQSMNQQDMFFKWLYYAGAVLLLVLVQSLVLNRISVWAVHPFLPPVIAGIMAMLEGPAEGAVFGGIFGLLCDLTMPGVIPCFYTLAFLAAALPAAMIAKRLLSQGFLCGGPAGRRQRTGEHRRGRGRSPAGDHGPAAHGAADLPAGGGAERRPVADGAGAGRDGGAVAAGVSAAAQRAQPDPEIGGVP